MIRTRKRHASAPEGAANKSRTTQPAAAPSVAPPSVSQLSTNERNMATAEGEEEECIIDDIKLDVYKIQQQWLSSAAEIAPTPTSASTSATVANAKKTMTVQRTAENSEGVCLLDIDKHDGGGISASLRDCSQNIEKIKSNNGDGAQSMRLKLKPASVIKSEFNFDADELDMQETDSDEEGCPDVNFEEEFELIECEGDMDMYAPDWSNNLDGQRKVFINENYKGILEGAPKSSFSTYYFYKLLGGDGFFKSWSKCCNKRATEAFHSTTHFEEFTSKEMSIFYGICLQMGSSQLTTLAEYWECEAHHGFGGYSRKLSLDRFLQILKFLSFESLLPEEKSTKTDDQSEEKFVDLKPILKFFNERMESVYNCGRRIVLNEPIMYWKGRLHWANDMSLKFRSNAVMLHLLTEQSGLVLKILVDLENPQRKKDAHNSKSFLVQRLSIAMELLSEKLHKGHTVFASKYYGSYALCLELGKLGTYSSGLLEIQRFGNSKELVLKNLKQYQSEIRYADFIMMGKSRRREKNIYFYSSDCLVTKYIQTRGGLKIVKEIDWQLKTAPKIRAYLLDYQLALERTEMKWDKRLMIFVMHLVLFNAYLFFTTHAQSGTRSRSYQTFRQEIITSLLNPRFDLDSADDNDLELSMSESKLRKGFPDKSRAPQSLKLTEHLPIDVPNFNGQRVRKRCRICDKGGLKTFSKTCCGKCPGMPGLCVTPCFKMWHGQMQSTSGHN
ncbi:PREDICTED: uncharacterized protein LOC108378249 [Rhagoletis zephyria]|uniref:uncharacterized protein LOC108378249 n=1 Tax=Rhagoletis zephyria TaxID=28612 RepID=UPI0008113947|nr:PREDICTED: uncharacterized protein LOC108378249 [Rhagoletis zephyria]